MLLRFCNCRPSFHPSSLFFLSLSLFSIYLFLFCGHETRIRPLFYHFHYLFFLYQKISRLVETDISIESCALWIFYKDWNTRRGESLFENIILSLFDRIFFFFFLFFLTRITDPLSSIPKGDVMPFYVCVQNSLSLCISMYPSYFFSPFPLFFSYPSCLYHKWFEEK